MRPLLHQQVTIERLTREPGHWFYGYYDLQPFSTDNEYHLTHRVDFEHRLNSPYDTATVGLIRLRDNQFIPVDETQAWNWQQGSMLRWNPAAPNDEIMYNALYNEGFRTKVVNVRTGAERLYDRPAATVDANGKWALSINFARIWKFRPGYGYPSLPDPFDGDNAPSDDGVFRIDMETGDVKLILSTKDMYELAVPYFKTEEEKNWEYVINHITLNPSGTRFVALLRGRPGPLAGWHTYTITANIDGSDPYVLLDNVASHYHWKDDSHIMFYARTYGDHVWGLYEFTDKTHEFVRLDPRNTMPYDGHCNYTPDRRLILNDTYPEDGYRHLYLYDPQKDISVYLLSAMSLTQLSCGDIRTDLHPRWSPDGTQISFDSTHEGRRHIYRIRVEDIGEDIWTRPGAILKATAIKPTY